MKRAIFVAFAAVALLAFASSVPAQPVQHTDSKKAEFVLSEALVVGTATLTPGAYKYQCRHLDGKTFLVIWSAENGKEVVRVPCRPETLTGKVTASDYRSTNKEGKRVLTSVRIKGETIAHVVVTD